MAGLKELRTRLQSVRNTKKITYAMKLVSAAKLRKTSDTVIKLRAYSSGLYSLLADIVSLQADAINSDLLLEVRPVRRVALIVIGGNRGLAGAYNANLNRQVESFYKDFAQSHPGVPIDAVVLGRKPVEFYKRTGKQLLASYDTLGEEPLKWPLDSICLDLEGQFKRREIDQVYLIYSEFRSALSIFPRTEKLLPLDRDTLAQKAKRAGVGDADRQSVRPVILLEPSSEELLAELIPRIYRAIVRQAALDSKASEHGSRMTAMDAATKNAGELINRLKLKYNKLRQSNITSEMLDILGGAEAIK